MNAAALARLQREYNWRAPIIRFPSAHYDTLPEDVSKDSSDRVILEYDKSGNSAVNCLVLRAGSGNYASFTALTAFGTGDFSVSVAACADNLTTSQTLIGGTTFAFSLRVNAVDGKLYAYKNGLSFVGPTTTGSAALTEYVFGYARVGGTGTFYINGAVISSAPDPQDYSAGVSEIGSNLAGTSNNFSGTVKRARVYSAGLDATAMAADAAGTVQANCVFNEDFSTAAKLAPSVTAATGQTVTINTTGATGARISGARDLYQGLVANMPVLTIAATGNYLTFDGSNDYLKSPAFALAQPETVYFVGSQVTWTANDGLLDGNALDSMQLADVLSSPKVSQYAGAEGFRMDFPVSTNAVVTAIYNGTSGFIRLNRNSGTTQNVGTTSANGFTLGAKGNGSSAANITASEVLVYAAAHDEIAQQRHLRHDMRQRRMAMAA